MKFTLLVVVLLILGLVALVRLVPSDPQQWHKAADGDATGHRPGANWHIYRETVQDGRARLTELDAVLRTLPRTKALAGSVAEGQITYVTRSRLMGFPDYTTLTLRGDLLEIYARARFGTSDVGVNRARVMALPGVPQA